MDTEECDDEADDEHDRVCRVIRAEALEENEGCDDCGGREADIVQWINPIYQRSVVMAQRQAHDGSTHTLVENVSSALLK